MFGCSSNDRRRLGDTISGDYVGVMADGKTTLSEAFGVFLSNGARGNTISGDVISGNGTSDVTLLDSGTTGNVIAGNFIGTDATGTKSLPGVAGVSIIQASRNTIGGTTAAARNVISSNQVGVQIIDSGTTNNVVEGNYIGTDVTGTVSLANEFGVVIRFGAHANTIGGSAAGARNVISGNALDGVQIYGGASANVVAGDYIGTDASGVKALGNAVDGVNLGDGVSRNTVGGTTAGARNVISHNGDAGVVITDAGTTANVVAGDYIGTDATGAKAMGNFGDGVDILDGASGNTIGGTTAGARDVISGNLQAGVVITNAGTSSNVVSGDYVGTALTGAKDLGNNGCGVDILDDAWANTAGGTTAGARDVISGNSQSGVVITNAGTTENVVSGDYFGTDLTGAKALGNVYDGVVITSGASENTIGGTTASTLNVISSNGIDGVQIDYTGTVANVVTGDYIGTDSTGTKALGNARDGVYLWAGFEQYDRRHYGRRTRCDLGQRPEWGDR